MNPTDPDTQPDLNANLVIGRDLNPNLDLQLNEAQKQALLAQLLLRLRSRDVSVQEGVVRSAEAELVITPAHLEALRQLQSGAANASLAEREAFYLTRVCVDPAYRQWRNRYVILAGGYRPAPASPLELVPRYSEVQVRGDGPQREIERVRLPDIREALHRHAAFILLAPPGAGKTTVLQHLCHSQALARLREPERERIPLFVRLAEQKPDEDPDTFLARIWQRELLTAHDSAVAEFQAMLKQGRLCLLCDALNEARREKIDERTDDWREFARRLPDGNRLLFSSRTQDYTGRLKLQIVEIDPLDDEQIQNFARAYLSKDSTRQASEGIAVPDRGDAFWLTLHERHADLLPLARIPYYLLMLVGEFGESQELPRQRAQLFERMVSRLLGRELEKRHEPWIDARAQQLALSELAFDVQDDLGVGTEMERSYALAHLPASVSVPSLGEVSTPPAVILHLASSASILAEPSGGAVKFMHHLLHEYFAAEALLRRWQAGFDLDRLWRVPSLQHEMPPAPRGQWDPLPAPPTTHWEQTTILAAGLCPELVESVRRVNPALAAACLLDQGPDADPDRVQQSQAELLARLGSVAFHLRSRIEAGLLLGKLGDPRFAPETVGGVRLILPPLVEIAAGRATIGAGWWNRGADGDERPRHSVDLAAYAIGRYPLTNAEYAWFMQAGGYEEERFWTAGGKYWRRGETPPGEEDPVELWMQRYQRRKANPREIDDLMRAGNLTEQGAADWRELINDTPEAARELFQSWYPTGVAQREPRFWRDDDLNNASQPLVGITWYEAAAYATWLAEVSGLAFRLPSEVEWEWAARRGLRPWPWGWRWHEARLNSLEGRVMRTTPVGAYAQGATPDGIYDLAGNVWEWTATRDAPYPTVTDDGRNDLDAPGIRVVRGGGYTAIQGMVRCGRRYRYYPRCGLNTLGVRLARGFS